MRAKHWFLMEATDTEVISLIRLIFFLRMFYGNGLWQDDVKTSRSINDIF